MRWNIIIMAAAFFLSSAGACLAACTSPAGADGQLRYDISGGRLYVCAGNNWVAAGGGNICCGWTQKDGGGWTNYTTNDSIYRDVNTSGCAFASVPVYLTTLSGDSNHFILSGVTSIYAPTATGFRIYLKNKPLSGFNVTPALADSNNYHVNWCGIGSINAASSTGRFY